MYRRIDCYVPKHADEAMILTTGDQFITNAVSINNGADMVDMEGFAIAYVANRYDIPITLIKGISDDANHNSKAELFQNLEMSMDQTIALLKTILD